MNSPRAREAFLANADWLLEDENGIERRVRRLGEHAQFFVALDRLGDEQWTGEFLLNHFTTSSLRRFELPVKWIEARSGTTLSGDDKRNAAELRRVKEAVGRLPVNTLARQVVDSFVRELLARHDAGELSVRSARLALRPAIALMQEEDSASNRLPGQVALESYISKVPGQRAAVSTFLAFLKTRYDVSLKLPPRRTPAAARKLLEKQIASMVEESRRSPDVDKRWIVLALRYFHHLSATDAKAIHAAATRVDIVDGIELRMDKSTYWIPVRPGLPFGQVR